MKSRIPTLCLAALASVSNVFASPALTIYNQDFAVVRNDVPLDLQEGENTVQFSGVTVHLEPDSVVLRDPEHKVDMTILEQSYRADTISHELMLSLFEGQEIDFLVRDQDGREFTVKGTIIRSGYLPNVNAAQRYGDRFFNRQVATAQSQSPIIEIDGQLRFSLPGEPIFPKLTDDAILKPTLTWRIGVPQAEKFDAELSYITGGMSWSASYNLIAPEDGDTVDIVGWITIDNQSGTDFQDATIKLMAGDVGRISPEEVVVLSAFEVGAARSRYEAPEVTEKAFDEFHLYSVPRATTLRNRETKQIEMLRATGVKTTRFYVYNGAAIDANRYRGWNYENIRSDHDYGTQSNPKVWVMREFDNSEENGLGIPLPYGRVRFYREDEADSRLEFTGENLIDHTPRNETIRVYTGDAFDVVGERKRTDYVMSDRNDWVEETFEIKLRNRKEEPVEVRVTEQLYRWTNWQILRSSHAFEKTEAQNIEFRVAVPADGETVVTYRVRYDWQ